ncbi:MAG: single-stranded DNA-binding protein [Clostridia bacterium]|nr:single-stranded DNA-binding protein [Clostridia bacterium]
MNKVILMGRLTRDPEMRQTTGGIQVCSFSVAVNRRFAKDGQQNADFINCTAWRQQAEFICKYFHKGSMIALVGSLQSRSWENQEGKRQYATDVVVDEVYFTGSRQESNTGAQEGGYNMTQPAPQQEADVFGDIDSMGFQTIEGSEDDLPF